MKKYWKIELLLALISVAVLTGCGLSIRAIYAWQATSLTTQGEVTAVREERSNEGEQERTGYYYPMITFRAATVSPLPLSPAWAAIPHPSDWRPGGRSLPDCSPDGCPD